MRPFARLRPVLLALALAAGAPAMAQDLTVGFDPRTGDVWVDTWLDDVNRYGRAYREPFVDELVRYHGAPRELVVELLGRPGWTPGDVYYACSLASVLGRPCRYVVDEYERDRGAGWGALAQRLGVKPGSAEFHRLKRGFVPTYDRWSRPIQLDADLERAFPGRAKGQPAVDRDGKAGDAGKGSQVADSPPRQKGPQPEWGSGRAHEAGDADGTRPGKAKADRRGADPSKGRKEKAGGKGDKGGKG